MFNKKLGMGTWVGHVEKIMRDEKRVNRADAQKVERNWRQGLKEDRNCNEMGIALKMTFGFV